ncbi:MAG: hypothetical protein QOI66_4852, partial [Myxococcales bacterium]|nr:hypothetical protein [Myxococcales bacterium]
MSDRRVRVCLVIVMLTVLVSAQRADACSVPGAVPHVIDPSKQATDITAPPPPIVMLKEIKRGRGPQGGPGCSSSSSSCDDLGTVTLSIAATDDDSPPQSIGYRIQLVSGRLPGGLDLPGDSRPLSPVDQNGQIAIYLNWVDG